MGENTKIEWCDHTFNPWIGCQKVSPGCDHCYAETQNNFRKWNGGTWGPHAPRKRTSVGYWKQPLLWAIEGRIAGVRPRVFCASLADIFDNQAPEGARDDLWALIRATPELDWLLLTKRPENIGKILPADWGDGYANVWLGTTAENQEQADRRGRILRNIPARIRFFSCEPLLSAITIEVETIQALDWVIVGGESGGDARQMDVEWARGLRDQCETAGVYFLFKQWGAFVPEINGRYRRVSKKIAGRILDGAEYNGFPEVRA